MKPLIILASNDYHTVQAFGPYKNNKIAREAKAKYEAKYPLLNFLILPVNAGFMVKSKKNQ